MIIYTIEQCMHLKKQKLGFRINRPAQGCYIFLHFINPILITVDNKPIQAAANACIIYKPEMSQDYMSKNIEMLHNYVRFQVSDRTEFESLGLVFGQIFYTNQPNTITSLVESCEFYKISRFGKSPQNNIQKNMEELINLLLNEVKGGHQTGTKSQPMDFDTLRTSVYQNPEKWSVTTMAEHVHLSRAYFSIKYKELYGKTPHEDLSFAKVLMAEKLLLTSNKNILDIAYECGFNSLEYFNHFFKRTKGMTPGQFRKQASSGDKIETTDQ